LQGNDRLATLLFQVCSPAHIPWGDTRWQDLLHGYDVWVHLEYVPTPSTTTTTDPTPSRQQQQQQQQHQQSNHSILQQACQSMAQHAATSSNLAALSLHVTRMLKQLVHEFKAENSSSTTTNASSAAAAASINSTEAFSKRISRVAKARATAGALVLLRILAHPVVLRCSSNGTTGGSSNENSCTSLMEDAFTYRTRGDLPRDKRAGVQLIHALMDWISIGSNSMSTFTTTTTTPGNAKSIVKEDPMTSSPEVYDALVFSFQLLLVLSATQLYQPFTSSFASRQPQHYVLEQLYNHRPENDHDDDNNTYRPAHFRRGSSSSSLRSGTRSMSSVVAHDPEHKAIWNPRSILAACWEWQIRRPTAPDRSIARYHAQLAQSVVATKGETISPDGMYETHAIVQAAQLDFNTSSSSLSMMAQNTQQQHHHFASSSDGNASSFQQQYQALHDYASSGGRNRGSMLLDATRGVLVLSSTIILLPFRLMSLVLGVWGGSGRKGDYQYDAKQRLQAVYSSRTKDVVWLSDSILADLASSLILLLVNNQRNTNIHRRNPFRDELAALTDNRWDPTSALMSTANNGPTGGGANGVNAFQQSFVGLPDLPSQFLLPDGDDINNFSMSNLVLEEPFAAGREDYFQSSMGQFPPRAAVTSSSTTTTLALNFESLFMSFGRTLHTEVGALSLYTLLQSSTKFFESLAVRSDLDTLVLPLLRTLYFATASQTYAGHDATAAASLSNRHSIPPTSAATATNGSSAKSSGDGAVAVVNPAIRSCPFRSQSQLYVIIILLLLFSQDASFGRDAFRRITIPHVPWYKERNLRNINLGSVLLLTLLRSLLFNLLRVQDTFLLSNCCAVLMNLSPAIIDLHEYAAMRLASVTVSVMKRHLALHQQGQKKKKDQPEPASTTPDVEDDWSTPLGMYAEVSRTLLSVLKHCVSARNMEHNLHLVYALIYHQADFQKFFPNKAKVGATTGTGSGNNNSIYRKSEIGRIQAVMTAAAGVIHEEGARSAGKALKILESKSKDILAIVASEGGTTPKRNHNNTGMDGEDFTFTYEEEADPEVFFVPYVWEVIACTVTSSLVEWDKHKVLAFPLFEGNDEADQLPQSPLVMDAPNETTSPRVFTNDVSDVV
jgi:hypothetical protein